MQRTEKAPVGQGTASEGFHKNVPPGFIADSQTVGKSAPKPYSLAKLYQMQSETRCRLAGDRRKGFWLRQQMKDIQDQYADNLFTLYAINDLIAILRLEGEGR